MDKLNNYTFKLVSKLQIFKCSLFSKLLSNSNNCFKLANTTLIYKCLRNLAAQVLSDMLKPFLGFWLNYQGRCCGKLQSALSQNLLQTDSFFL